MVMMRIVEIAVVVTAELALHVARSILASTTPRRSAAHRAPGACVGLSSFSDFGLQVLSSSVL